MSAFKTLALAGLVAASGVAAHDFKQCGSTDNLHVSAVTLNPDPVKAGGNLDAAIDVTPSVDVAAATVTLKVSAFGVTVLTKDFDICKLTACPLKKGAKTTLKVDYPIPAAAPAITAQAEFDVKLADGSPLDCVDLKVQVVKSTKLFGEVQGVLTEENHQFLFQKWMEEHSKQYEMKEIFQKYNTFKSNLGEIMQHEASGHDWHKAMNFFGDLTKDEFKAMYTSGYTASNNKFEASNNLADLSGVEAADSVDWRTKGAVSPVKNQGQCGSCWAFSTVGGLEGANQIANGGPVQQFSEQELVDCAGSEGNQGCNGGLMDNGFKWVMKNGLCKEGDYTPYSASDGTCTKSSCKSDITITGYKDVAKNEDALKKAVSLGPVSIAIEADQSGFQFYKSGVFTGTCGKQLDHGVLNVGYGTENGKDYWIVKNSWAATWGDAGYIKIGRGSDLCGITDAASYPTM